jgi:uncharacterized protein (TIGR03435 family)
MILRSVIGAFVTVVATAALAQQLDTSPHFEVVSIKVSKVGDTTPSFRPSPSGRFEWQNLALEALISVAHQTFAFDEVEIVGLPAWARTARFDIVAQTGTGTPPIDANGFPADLAAMIRSMLAERFHLAAHREKQGRAAYLLQTVRPGRLGPQLKQVDGDCGAALASLTGGRLTTPRPARGPDCSFGGGPGRMQGNAISLEMFSRVLGRLLSRPVIDQTGLTGSFDLDLRYRPDSVRQTAASDPPLDPELPSIFTAIQEQLGLRLVGGRASVDVLIVDALDRPAPD